MNHNYYYALLGRQAAGGPGQAAPAQMITNRLISEPSPEPCNLFGPTETPVWVNNLDWPSVTLVTLDQAGTQPFAGGGNWFFISEDNFGTTLRIDDSGRVIDLFAC